MTSAHVFAYEEKHGPLPKGQVLRHRCNNKRCVRPSHLLPGTQHQNILDSVRAGTHRNPIMLGEHNPNAKLTAQDVADIRSSLTAATVLAWKYGVQVRQIRRVRDGSRWASRRKP